MSDALDLDRAALIVLDWQDFFVSPGSPAHIPETEAAGKNVRALVESFLAARRPVFATRHGHARGECGSFMRFYGRVIHRDEPGFDLAPFLKGREGVESIEKNTYSAFATGELGRALASLGVATVVLAGCQADKCVVANALAAFDLGFDVVVAADACAARSQERREAALGLLQRSCASMKTTPVLFEELAKSRCGAAERP